MPTVLTQLESNIIKATSTGKITEEDVLGTWAEGQGFLEKYSTVYVLVELIDFEGWSVKAVWERMKNELTYHTRIERIAVVAPRKWQEWFEQFSTPLSIAKTAYFAPGESKKVFLWLKGSRPSD